MLSLDGQRLHVLFDQASIDQLAERFQPRERLDRTAAKLGIPTYAVRELVESGLLRTAPAPPGRTKKLSVFEASLANLIGVLNEKMSEATHDHSYSLAKLMLRLGGQTKPWASVLAAICAGELKASMLPGSHRVAERIYFSSDEVLSHPAFRPRSALDWVGFTVPKSDLADMLSLSRSNFSRYSDYLVGSGDHLAEIDIRVAVELAEAIISTTEIAARLKIHHTAAFRLATQRMVSVKSDGLFDRASADALIPELSECRSGIATQCQSGHAQLWASSSRVMHAVIASDGRMKLPAHLRNRLGLMSGGKVVLEEANGNLVLRPVP